MKTTDPAPEDPIPSTPPSHKSTAKKAPDQGNQLADLNLSDLRLSQNFADQAGVKRAILTIPVRKPPRQAFVRVHPGEEWRYPTLLLNLKEERETYLVHPSLTAELGQELTPTVLHLAIDRLGVVFLWPTRLPASDGRLDEWSRTAAEAAELAEGRWISLRANMSLGAYEVFEATGNIPDPEWPDLTLEQAIRIAFKDRFIDSPSHPVVRRLRGEA